MRTTFSLSFTPHGAVTAKRTSSDSPRLPLYSNAVVSLAPKYEELAAMYPASSKVTIAKVDATANDVPDEVQGFPTIKLFPAGAKTEPLTYSGSRTIEDLAAFIKENGKYKVDAFEGKNDTEGGDVPLADGMGEAAKAATETVKSVVSEASEAAKDAVTDDDALDSGEEHDEL